MSKQISQSALPEQLTKEDFYKRLGAAEKEYREKVLQTSKNSIKPRYCRTGTYSDFEKGLVDVISCTAVDMCAELGIDFDTFVMEQKCVAAKAHQKVPNIYHFAKGLDVLLRNKNYAAIKVSAEIGVASSVVGYWRRGDTTPTVYRLYLLCRYFNTTPSAICDKGSMITTTRPHIEGYLAGQRVVEAFTKAYPNASLRDLSNMIGKVNSSWTHHGFIRYFAHMRLITVIPICKRLNLDIDYVLGFAKENTGYSPLHIDSFYKNLMEQIITQPDRTKAARLFGTPSATVITLDTVKGNPLATALPTLYKACFGLKIKPSDLLAACE